MVTKELRSRLRQKMERRRKRMKAVIRKRRELANADLKALILAARSRRRAVRIWERDEKKFEKEREMAKQAQAAKEQEGISTENKDEKDGMGAHEKAQRRVSFSDTIRIKYIPSLRDIKAAQALRRKKKRRTKSKRLLRESDTKWKRPEIDTTASSTDEENSKLSAWFSSVTDSASAARAQSSEALEDARRRSPSLGRPEGSLTISKKQTVKSSENDDIASSTTDNSHPGMKDISSSPLTDPAASDQGGRTKVKSAGVVPATDASHPVKGNICSSLSSDQRALEQKDPSGIIRTRSSTDPVSENQTEMVSPAPSRSSPKRRKKKVPSSPVTSSTVSSATSLPNPQENTGKPSNSKGPAVRPASAPVPVVCNQSSPSPKETMRQSTKSSPPRPRTDKKVRSVLMSSSTEQAVTETKLSSEAACVTPVVNGANSEIEEIFAGMKRKRIGNQVEVQTKKTKFQNENSGPMARRSSWDKGARYSSDGLRIYTYDELAQDQPEGLNGPCPFECSCCF